MTKEMLSHRLASGTRDVKVAEMCLTYMVCNVACLDVLYIVVFERGVCLVAGRRRTVVAQPKSASCNSAILQGPFKTTK